MGRRRVSVGVGIVCAVVVCGAHLSSAATVSVAPPLTFAARFETNTLEGLAVSGNAPTVQSQFSRAGSRAMRSYLNRKTSNNMIRTEVTTGYNRAAVIGQEYWYGFSIYLPNPHPSDSVPETLAQWHSIKDSSDTITNPPLVLQVRNGDWRVVTRYAAAQPTTNASKKETTIDLNSHAVGEWTDWVFRVKWSYQSDGILQVWKDGAMVVNRSGPNCYNDQKGPYFKMGIYKPQWKNGPSDVDERLVYHDEFRMAKNASYQDVAPGSQASSPSPATSLTVN